MENGEQSSVQCTRSERLGSCLGTEEGEWGDGLGWTVYDRQVRNGLECYKKGILIFEYEEEELSNILKLESKWLFLKDKWWDLKGALCQNKAWSAC